MYLALLGLALLGLGLYISTLTKVLRAYSRARLTECLSDTASKRWLDWLDRHEGELQVGTSLLRLLCNIGLFAFVIIWAATETIGVPELVELMTPAAIVLGVLIVVNIGLSHALATHVGEEILAHSFHVLSALRVLLWPMTQLLMGVEFVVRRLLGKAETTDEQETERREEEILEHVSEAKALGAVDEEQEDMIEAVLELHSTTVSAIMTPRTDIVAIPVDAPLDDVRDIIIKAGHSRIPVIEQSLDQIVGVLYVKDLVALKSEDQYDLRGMMREAPYVPETKTIDALLREFRQRQVHIAIVLDEYGGTAGLVTFEDILEELVGEIDDEYDTSSPPAINRIDNVTLEVDARVHISDINEELEDLDVELPEDGDYETIGGFVFTALGKIPAAGEEVSYENIHIKVLSAEDRKINRLRIHVAVNERQTA